MGQWDKNIFDHMALIGAISLTGNDNEKFLRKQSAKYRIHVARICYVAFWSTVNSLI